MIGPLRRTAAILALGSLLAVAIVQGRAFREVDGILEGRDAFEVHRPYALHFAMGRLAPGARFVMVGQVWPEVLGESLGRTWITEALTGGARADRVEWIDQPSGWRAGSDLVGGRLLWSARDSLLGDATLMLGDGPVGTLVVERIGEDAVRIVDLRLLPTELAALIQVEGGPE